MKKFITERVLMAFGAGIGYSVLIWAMLKFLPSLI